MFLSSILALSIVSYTAGYLPSCTRVTFGASQTAISRHCFQNASKNSINAINTGNKRNTKHNTLFASTVDTFSTNCVGVINQYHGAFNVHTSGNKGEVSVGDALTIYYTPPDNYFHPSRPLSIIFGYNTPTTQKTIPSKNPLLPTWDVQDYNMGTYKVTSTVPPPATSLFFHVTDGILYDDGPDGSGFKIHVSNVNVEVENGKFKRGRHDVVTKAIKTV
mmetsp:Transcript_14231/g.29221  ORF Transcript_14231/g.29221 Transcript_14231/m.29221 type:complete len:219 (-) Transcript_14231:7-663(-)